MVIFTFCWDRSKQDLLMGQLFRQTDRLSEAIRHTQVYEMVCQYIANFFPKPALFFYNIYV